MKNQIKNSKKVKAIGLLSGGLDSFLAAKVVSDLDVEVYGITFVLPWNHNKIPSVIEKAKNFNINVIAEQLDNEFLQMVKNPRHGYGSAINPCIDCKIFMITKAKKHMEKIGADFIFTGEVLGQRPMSQKRNSLNCIEKNTNLSGKLLRPLCAKRMEPTIAEKEGLIDRNKLLDFTGRSRKMQIQLAKELNITNYSQPAGGCHLTEKSFASRLNDFFQYDWSDFKNTASLLSGKHFRINANFKAILGRDESDNEKILQNAKDHDYIMEVASDEKAGPTLVLKGKDPTEEVLSISSGLIQNFSKYKNEIPLEMKYWQLKSSEKVSIIKAKKLTPIQIKEMYL